MNYFIIEKYYKPEYFSSYATYNKTGMGIMSIYGNANDPPEKMKMHYKHVVTPRTYEVVDEFEVLAVWKEDGGKKERGNLNIELE